ncbi:MAG: helix-turn-helix domain-containing protein, partial [Myxococcales bacterium]|nr:helix-turn-helix domain-containing protein [Myxococcales bacterium]
TSTEIAERVGMNNKTVHRFLLTMEEERLVELALGEVELGAIAGAALLGEVTPAGDGAAEDVVELGGDRRRGGERQRGRDEGVGEAVAASLVADELGDRQGREVAP